MLHESPDNEFGELRQIETEITEDLALLGRWSHLFETLAAREKESWKTVVAKAQGSLDRAAVRTELDQFIQNILRPRVERLG